MLLHVGFLSLQQRSLSTAACRVLAMASLVADTRSRRVASVVVAHGLWLSSCSAGPQVPCGMWDLPRAEIKPVSLASQGRFLTAGPPGKPLDGILTSI